MCRVIGEVPGPSPFWGPTRKSQPNKSILKSSKVMLTGCAHGLKSLYTANILAVLSTAFGSVTFPTVIWLYSEQPMAVHSQ